MKTRKVKKESIVELARLKRKFAKYGDTDILSAMTAQCRQVSQEAYGKEANWCTISDFMGALCGIRPLKNCTNDEIFEILKLVGIEVV
nr:MAG TPA: hypothetical protein [Caudoviricetes sp.]